MRIATPLDEKAVMDLCVMLHEENGQHPLNIEKVRYVIRRCLAGQMGIIGVVGNQNDLRGAICILIDPVWYSDDLQLLELFNFCHPDHRRPSCAKPLIEFAKKCADETGLDLTIGVLSNIRMEAKVKLYGRMLPKAGEFFVYSPQLNRAAA